MLKERRILILEDEIIVAEDMKELLQEENYTVYVAHNYSDALELAKNYQPHLAICDINLGDRETGIDFSAKLRDIMPEIEIIYVTAFNTISAIEEAQETNPLNYIVKPWSEEQIKTTVRIAFLYIDKKWQRSGLLNKLSFSEFRVLKLIAQQKSSKEIADELFIAEKTVRNHRYNIIKKLDLPNDKNTLLKWAITFAN